MNLNLIFNQEIKSFDLRSIYQYVESEYGVFVVKSIKEYVKLSKRIEKCIYIFSIRILKIF